MSTDGENMVGRLRQLVLLVLSSCTLIACAAQQNVLPTLAPSLVAHAAEPVVTPNPTGQREFNRVPVTPEAPSQPLVDEVYLCGETLHGAARQYTVVSVVDYAEKQAQVAQQVRFANDTGVFLDRIVFFVEANHYAGAFDLQSVRLANDELAPVLDGAGFSVSLPDALPPGCVITLDLTFRVLPPAVGANGVTKGYLGYSPRQLNLSYWLPTISPYFGGDWVLNEAQFIGEQAVLEQADWDVTLDIKGLQSPPVVAAPGLEISVNDANRWRYELLGSRDFAVSISPSYRVQKAQAQDGTWIEVYTFPDAIVSTGQGTLDGGEHVVNEALRSYEQFVALYGEYPYDRLLVVQGDFPDGMEFSGLVYVGTRWFYDFTGGVRNYLTLITVHEIAHQWWYASVGNDPANAPWLDEALATYSEYIYLEEYYPEHKDWWWAFRINSYAPTGQVDRTVYEFGSMREYINAVYLRGVQMLHRIRQDVGTEVFFAWLFDYAQAASGRIATPGLLWSQLPIESYVLTDTTRAQFFQQPNALPLPPEQEKPENINSP